MPRKSHVRRRPRRVVKRALRKHKSRAVNVIRGRGPVAPRTIVRLKYDQSFSWNGTDMDATFNLNSIFSPTSGGHQPYGRDTYATLYNRYRVIACSYHLTIVDVTSTAFKVSVGADNDATLRTNASLAAESPSYVTKSIQQGYPGVFKGRFYLPAVTGVKPSTYKSDDRYQSVMSASPLEVICLHIVASTFTDVAPTATSLFANLRLIYHVECFDPTDLAQS